MFPRLQKRGPIEADPGRQHTDRLNQFPRLQKRGPIEAGSIENPTLGDLVFPRLQKRGPIEAITGGSPWGIASRFPRLQKRGPIEASSCQPLKRSPRTSFHAYKSVAPLKLPLRRRTSRPGLRVSTLTKAWPH